MTEEDRKAAIRRRLVLAKHPRRHRAEFTDENDHNPMVLQACPQCHGSGHVGRAVVEGTRSIEMEETCPNCHGEGVTGEVEPYFANDKPEADAVVIGDGITCPNCGWRFRLKDSNAWTGRRHRRCGQKIKLVAAEE